MLSPSVNSTSISNCTSLNVANSPKQSPTNSGILTNSADPITTISDTEDDKNNNNPINKDSSDENYDNDTISVTGSPEHTSNSVDIEDDRKSPPMTGAFTSLIQKSGSSSWRKYNSEILPQFHHSNQSAFNQALAAQLFLQNPLIPPSSQWLYNQLYGNQQEFPWFRHHLLSNSQQTNGTNFRLQPPSINEGNNNNNNELNLGTAGMNLVKKQLEEVDEQENLNEKETSPPVSSSKRSPSPELRTKVKKRSTNMLLETKKISANEGKQADVWRPY